MEYMTEAKELVCQAKSILMKAEIIPLMQSLGRYRESRHLFLVKLAVCVCLQVILFVKGMDFGYAKMLWTAFFSVHTVIVVCILLRECCIRIRLRQLMKKIRTETDEKQLIRLISRKLDSEQIDRLNLRDEDMRTIIKVVLVDDN